MKKIIAVLLCVAMLLCMAACGGSENKAPAETEQPAAEVDEPEAVPQKITYNATESPSYDPIRDTQSGEVVSHMFEGLTCWNQGEIVNGQAKSIECSEDGLVYTITLRDDIFWSDGKPVTAQDFYYSWMRELEAETAAKYVANLYIIKNASASNAGECSAEEVGLEVKDDKTLIVTMEAPVSYFEELLAFKAYLPVRQDIVEANGETWAQTPEHWFGTDSLGRDLFIRVLYGGRISLTVGVVSAFINLVIGSLYGGISGYLGGRADQIMMRIVDILYSIPTLLYVLLITMVWGSSIGTVIIAIALSSWAGMARTVRAQVLSLKEQEFVLAERTLGASRSRVLIHHLLINAIGPIIVTTTLNVPSAIFTEAFLSFVGCGIAIPKASWGTLSNEALRTVMNYPYQMVFPVLAIALTMFSLNFIGDGFNDAFDPRREK